VARHPDVIVTVTNQVVIALMATTTGTPIVAAMLDPLKEGLVTSLARPGGNLTGINLGVGVEIWGKRLQTLKEAIPSAIKVVFMGLRENWEGPVGEVLRDAGGRLGISLIAMLPREGTPPEIERVFALMARQRPDAVLVSGEGDQYAHRQLIIELAEKNRLPAMYAIGGYVEQGGLMAYVADLAEARHRLADDVHQILSGVKAGDIPIYQTTKFQLIINLKTANALGLAVPQSILARADEVIE
jgi:putative ABC transport system substrate-binding protein